MINKEISRRQAINLGAKTATGAMMGMQIFPAIISARNLRYSVREFNVMDYGAIGDGKSFDTAAIQQTIDIAAEAGGGARVIIPGGQRFLRVQFD